MRDVGHMKQRCSGTLYFCLSTFCHRNERNRQISFSLDKKFAMLMITVASLCQHCFTFCGVKNVVHKNIPTQTVTCDQSIAFQEGCLGFSDCNYNH